MNKLLFTQFITYLTFTDKGVGLKASSNTNKLPGLHFTMAVFLPVTLHGPKSAGESVTLMPLYATLSPKPKANNKQHRLCHPSLCCCPSMRRRQVAALPWGAAGFISQPPLPGAPHCPPTAKVHSSAGKPRGHWSLCGA